VRSRCCSARRCGMNRSHSRWRAQVVLRDHHTSDGL
jgi:hypothetical protein